MDHVGSSLGLDGIGSPSEAGNTLSHAEEFQKFKITVTADTPNAIRTTLNNQLDSFTPGNFWVKKSSNPSSLRRMSRKNPQSKTQDLINNISFDKTSKFNDGGKDQTAVGNGQRINKMFKEPTPKVADPEIKARIQQYPPGPNIQRLLEKLNDSLSNDSPRGKSHMSPPSGISRFFGTDIMKRL